MILKDHTLVKLHVAVNLDDLAKDLVQQFSPEALHSFIIKLANYQNERFSAKLYRYFDAVTKSDVDR